MIYKGKTLEFALENAEKSLGITRDNFSYEVEEKKIGIFKKEFEVNVIEIKNKSKLEIRNGKVFHHKGDGKAYIVPCEKTKVLVNDNEIKGKTGVEQGDIIEIVLEEDEEKRSFSIDIEKDRLIATLKSDIQPKRIYKVLDAEPSNIIEVKLKVIEEVWPKKITMEEVKEEILKHSIKFGVDFKLIEKAIENSSGVIAKGREKINPIDDKIQYFFHTSDKRKPVEINGKVDYYSIEEIQAVEKGIVLAEIKEGSEGVAGVDVLGNIIPATSKKSVLLKVGQGAEIIEDKTKIIATIAGKPSLKGGKVCVFPVHKIEGDVDIKVGNLEFDGDIVVSGTVREGMKINSGNNITINGSVLESNVTSKGSINIQGNLIASEVRAGNMFLNEMHYINELKQINGLLSKLVIAFEEIRKSMNQKFNKLPSGEIVKKIIDSKYSNKKAEIEKIRRGYDGKKMDSEIKNMLKQFFVYYDSFLFGTKLDMNEVAKYNVKLEGFISKFNVNEIDSNIYIKYSQNSLIYSANDVYINGKGCYSTDIEAEGNIIIDGMPGIFRSGNIYGKKGVKVKEIGSSAGVKSIIRTSRNGIIEADAIYHNTLLIIDNLNYYVDSPIRNVKVYIKDGELVVEKLKL